MIKRICLILSFVNLIFFTSCSNKSERIKLLKIDSQKSQNSAQYFDSTKAENFIRSGYSKLQYIKLVDGDVIVPNRQYYKDASTLVSTYKKNNISQLRGLNLAPSAGWTIRINWGWNGKGVPNYSNVQKQQLINIVSDKYQKANASVTVTDQNVFGLHGIINVVGPECSAVGADSFVSGCKHPTTGRDKGGSAPLGVLTGAGFCFRANIDSIAKVAKCIAHESAHMVGINHTNSGLMSWNGQGGDFFSADVSLRIRQRVGQGAVKTASNSTNATNSAQSVQTTAQQPSQIANKQSSGNFFQSLIGGFSKPSNTQSKITSNNKSVEDNTQSQVVNNSNNSIFGNFFGGSSAQATSSEPGSGFDSILGENFFSETSATASSSKTPSLNSGAGSEPTFGSSDWWADF